MISLKNFLCCIIFLHFFMIPIKSAGSLRARAKIQQRGHVTSRDRASGQEANNYTRFLVRVSPKVSFPLTFFLTIYRGTKKYTRTGLARAIRANVSDEWASSEKVTDVVNKRTRREKNTKPDFSSDRQLLVDFYSPGVLITSRYLARASFSFHCFFFAQNNVSQSRNR